MNEMVSIRLSGDLRTALDEMARVEGISRSDTIRVLLQRGMETSRPLTPCPTCGLYPDGSKP